MRHIASVQRRVQVPVRGFVTQKHLPRPAKSEGCWHTNSNGNSAKLPNGGRFFAEKPSHQCRTEICIQRRRRPACSRHGSNAATWSRRASWTSWASSWLSCSLFGPSRRTCGARSSWRSMMLMRAKRLRRCVEPLVALISHCGARFASGLFALILEVTRHSHCAAFSADRFESWACMFIERAIREKWGHGDKLGLGLMPTGRLTATNRVNLLARDRSTI